MASHTIHIFIQHYAEAIPGKTYMYICYGVSGCGKTVAAAHLLHGDSHQFDCPKRAIMVNAGGSEDFPTEFAQQQNAPNAAPLLVDILCASLRFPEKNKETRTASTKIWDFLSHLRRLLGTNCHRRTKHSFTRQSSTRTRHQRSSTGDPRRPSHFDH